MVSTTAARRKDEGKGTIIVSHSGTCILSFSYRQLSSGHSLTLYFNPASPHSVVLPSYTILFCTSLDSCR